MNGNRISKLHETGERFTKNITLLVNVMSGFNEFIFILENVFHEKIIDDIIPLLRYKNFIFSVISLCLTLNFSKNLLLIKIK